MLHHVDHVLRSDRSGWPHIFFEPPSHQYGSWVDGLGETPSGAHPPNLLHLASPVVGTLSVPLSMVLSLVTIAAIVSLIADARSSTTTGAGVGGQLRSSVPTGRITRGGSSVGRTRT